MTRTVPLWHTLTWGARTGDDTRTCNKGRTGCRGPTDQDRQPLPSPRPLDHSGQDLIFSLYRYPVYNGRRAFTLERGLLGEDFGYHESSHSHIQAYECLRCKPWFSLPNSPQILLCKKKIPCHIKISANAWSTKC
jgi:hypothetical protein